MAYIEVDINLGEFSDSDIISECVGRGIDPEFVDSLRTSMGTSVTYNFYNQQLWNIAKDMQAGKDVSEKLKNYIWDTVGVIV